MFRRELSRPKIIRLGDDPFIVPRVQFAALNKKIGVLRLRRDRRIQTIQGVFNLRVRLQDCRRRRNDEGNECADHALR